MSNERDYMPRFHIAGSNGEKADYHDLVMTFASILANACESGMDVSIYVSNPGRVVLPWPSIRHSIMVGRNQHDATQRIHMITDSRATLYMLRRLDNELSDMRISTLDPCTGFSRIPAGDPFILSDRISAHAAHDIVKKMGIKKKSIRKTTEKQLAALICFMVMGSNKMMREIYNQYSNILGVLSTLVANNMGHPDTEDDGYGYDPEDNDDDDDDDDEDVDYDDPFKEAREAAAAEMKAPSQESQDAFKDQDSDECGDNSSNDPASDAGANPIPDVIPTPSGHGFDPSMLHNLYGAMGTMGGLGGFGAALRGMIDGGTPLAGIMNPNRMNLDNIMSMPSMAALSKKERDAIRDRLTEVSKQLDSMGYQMTQDVAESVAGVMKDLDPGDPNALKETPKCAPEETASEHPTEDTADTDPMSCDGDSCPIPDEVPTSEDK